MRAWSAHPSPGTASQDNQIGPPAVISAVAEPSQVASGGTVALKMQVKDANGRGVGGQTIVLMASPERSVPSPIRAVVAMLQM